MIAVILRILFNKQFEELRNGYSSDKRSVNNQMWQILIILFYTIIFILYPIFTLISNKLEMSEIGFNMILLIAGFVVVYYEIKYIK